MNQASKKLDLKIWVFLSSYGLVALLASSEHAKPSALLPGKLVIGNTLRHEGLNVACWSLGYSW